MSGNIYSVIRQSTILGTKMSYQHSGTKILDVSENYSEHDHRYEL